jgi:GcrA cell cycle regulator
MDFAWTEAAVMRLRELFALPDEYLTAEQLARALSAEFGAVVSRNAVIGKLHRLGMGRPDGPRRPPVRKKRLGVPDKPSAAKTHQRARQRRSARTGVDLGPRERELQIRGQLMCDPARASAVGLAGLTARRCRWPLGGAFDAPPAELYCGAAVQDDGYPYCRAHCRRAYLDYVPGRVGGWVRVAVALVHEGGEDARPQQDGGDEHRQDDEVYRLAQPELDHVESPPLDWRAQPRRRRLANG